MKEIFKQTAELGLKLVNRNIYGFVAEKIPNNVFKEVVDVTENNELVLADFDGNTSTSKVCDGPDKYYDYGYLSWHTGLDNGTNGVPPMVLESESFYITRPDWRDYVTKLRAAASGDESPNLLTEDKFGSLEYALYQDVQGSWRYSHWYERDVVPMLVENRVLVSAQDHFANLNHPQDVYEVVEIHRHQGKIFFDVNDLHGQRLPFRLEVTAATRGYFHGYGYILYVEGYNTETHHHFEATFSSKPLDWRQRSPYLNGGVVAVK